MTVAKIGKLIRIRITLTITKVSKIKLSFLYQKYQQLPMGRFMGSVKGPWLESEVRLVGNSGPEM
jgi:hypothetical protein